jgi:hypothetical protein
MSCARLSLFTKVNRVPAATVSDFGDTPVEVMVNVVPPLGVGDGVGVGVGVGAGVGVGLGVGAGVGVGAGDGLGEVALPPLPHPARATTHAAATAIRTRVVFIARISSRY